MALLSCAINNSLMKFYSVILTDVNIIRKLSWAVWRLLLLLKKKSLTLFVACKRNTRENCFKSLPSTCNRSNDTDIDLFYIFTQTCLTTSGNSLVLWSGETLIYPRTHIVFRPAQKYHIHMETSPLSVKACALWPWVGSF